MASALMVISLCNKKTPPPVDYCAHLSKSGQYLIPFEIDYTNLSQKCCQAFCISLIGCDCEVYLSRVGGGRGCSEGKRKRAMNN